MDIQSHKQLLELLQQYASQQVTATYTQWDSESADEEEVIDFQATLQEFRLTDNEFGEKDLFLLFVDGDEETELLMEIPAVEEDLGVLEDGQFRLFGTEAELILKK